MSRTRHSKYRHIYGDAPKPEGHFLDVKQPLASGEGTYVKANPIFFAVSRSSGGGPIYIHHLDKPGRFQQNCPTINVHKGKTLDFDFHPFINNMIASGSEDCHICVSQFPLEGLTEVVTEPLVTMEGHMKKVQLVEFNPCASSILASSSFDRTVKVWNIETGECVNNFSEFGDNIYSIKWNKNGSILGGLSKDKTLRLYDPRQSDAVQTIPSFDGAKSSKLFWVPSCNWIGATGFSKSAKRQLKIWDVANLSEPIYKLDIDAAASILNPYFDDDIGVLYLAGKGDGSINYFEVQNDDKKVYPLGVYRNPEPQKGGGWVPKRGLDVWKCEVARFLKLTKNSVIPISLIVPRKVGADVFQDDIFPPCYAGKPALSADEWLGGENKDPVSMSMNPANRDDTVGGGNIVFAKKQTYTELAAENEALKAKIATLQQKLRDAGLDAGDDEAKEDS